MLGLGLNINRTKSVGGVVAGPVFVSATTNEAGTVITVTFDKEMANPTGKHAQFTVNDGSANAVTGAALNGTTTKIDLTLTNTIESSDTVTVAYTEGTVVSDDGGVLATFSAESVTNIVPSAYQVWSDYPNSPVITADYPYQFVAHDTDTGSYELWMSNKKMYYDSATKKFLLPALGDTYGKYSAGSPVTEWGDNFFWEDYIEAGPPFASEPDMQEANYDIYGESGDINLYFAQTT